MPTPEEEREWQNTLCIPFTKYANPGDRDRGTGNEQFRNYLEQFQCLKSAIGAPSAYKLTYNLVGYIQRTPAKTGRENYNQRLWLIPVPKPQFEHQRTDPSATNLALHNQKLEWIATTHYPVAMLFAESGHRVAGVPTGTPIETREEQEKVDV
ncbi:hypothetical protein GRF29_8g165585 [Pseudopithomyces chartarum]|uniref:Uncharacterized protein n=1 Tax=Pseudopithomyces chartarum TaxID=1892770 RepID=A0AAN6M736_9PLEO|nr:hypothetical protein GRF29_8g165585 [Pseudopithomyces chartarum]